MKKWAVILCVLASCGILASCDGRELFFPEGSDGSSVSLDSASETETVQIFYDLGECKGDTLAYLPKMQEELPYGAKINPPTPTCEGYIFKGWKTSDGAPLEATVYALNDGFTLIAVWEKDMEADRWYSPWV